MAKRKTKRRGKPNRLPLYIGGAVGVGLLAWIFWPSKAKAEGTGSSDGTSTGGGGTSPEGAVVSNDPWTLRTYPHSAPGTLLRIADTPAARANNNTARVRRDFRTTDGSWMVPIGNRIGHATGDSVKWEGVRFLKMRSQIPNEPNLDTWAAADLVEPA